MATWRHHTMRQPLRLLVTRSFLTRAFLTRALLTGALLFSPWRTSFVCAQAGVEARPNSVPEVAIPAAPESVRPLTSAEQTLLNALANRPPTSPRARMAAIENLLRIEQFESIRPLLQALSPADDAELLRLYDEFGPAVFVTLTQVPELAPLGSEFARRVLQVANRSRLSPRRLAALIDQLAAADEEVRNRAAADLYQTGMAAAPLLIHKLADAQPTARAPYLQALVRIGHPVVEPALAALDSSNSLLRGDMAALLGEVGDESVGAHLLQPYFDDAPYVRQQAAAALQKLWHAVPRDIPQAELLLRTRLARHMEGQTEGPLDEAGFVAIWSWDGSSRLVTTRPVLAADAAALTAARLARDLYRLQPNATNLQRFVATRLHLDKSLGGRDQALRRGPGTAYDLSVSAGVPIVEQVLDSALQSARHATAVAAAEVLAEVGSVDLLRSTNGQPRPVAKALRSGNRRVRYAAARAIMKLDPVTPYAGASYLTEALGDLVAVSARPRVLIGHPNAEIAGQLAGRLTEFGYDTEIRHTGNGFLRAALATSDFELLFVSDAVDCPPESEVFQQLRKDPHTLYTPAVILYRVDPGTHAERAELLAELDGRALAIPEEADHQALAAQLVRLRELASPDSSSWDVRVGQAQDSLNWLAQLARQPEKYGWYDLHRQEDAIVQSLTVGGLTDQALTLLGYLGSARAQTLLVEYASGLAGSEAASEQAGRAFGAAVSQRGVMLRGDQVLQQYERYNGSAGRDPASRKVLSDLLDAIEATTR